MTNLSTGKLIALVVLVLSVVVLFLTLVGVAVPAWTVLLFVAALALAVVLI